MTLIRGVVFITIGKAKHLLQQETILSKIAQKLTCSSHRPVDEGGTYVKVKIGDVKIGETTHIETGQRLRWNEVFRADLAHEADHINFEVFCDELVKDKCIGKLSISVEDLVNNPDNPDEWKVMSYTGEDQIERDRNYLPLCDESGNLTGAKLGITISFTSVPELSTQKSVGCAYFPIQSNCKVTLYQDADMPTSNPLFDDITLADSSSYQPQSAFKDIFNAICQAKHFIYFVGWSVWSKVKLVREEGMEGNNEELGDILIRKAEEGVRILGLVWDQKTSNKIYTDGLMKTFDEDSKKYFNDKGIDLELVYRKKEKGSVIPGELVEWVYSHHQKCVILDTAYPESERRHIMAFLGGLDLTKGRYDTYQHQLFSTLKSVHQDDFLQNCVSVAEDVGPREPWHDIHCKVEGPVALDVLCNFEERWKKQVPSKVNRLVDVYRGDLFNLTGPAPGAESQLWDCQLYRSITSDSASFEKHRSDKLTKKASALCDDSIQRGYVHHIRRAEKFIYIENQYFLGSAYAWLHDTKPKAHHVIPFEICNRIIDKMKKGERFCVYIVLPMFPEGNPASKAVQEILFWQKNTIEMMYKRIKIAIDETGLLTTPSDYLNIFCLGKREFAEPEDLADPNPESEFETKLRESRRFMIYVHSKMMIVDDEFIIIGSANINERSMGGTRDTEIAVGALQPGFIYDGESLPKGSVHAFRMALWAEHTGVVDESFLDPSSDECVQRVHEIAQRNWEIYSNDDTQDTQGFLITYPYNIEEDGTITAVDGFEHFPDFDCGAKVLGSNSFLPNKITT